LQGATSAPASCLHLIGVVCRPPVCRTSSAASSALTAASVHTSAAEPHPRPLLRATSLPVSRSAQEQQQRQLLLQQAEGGDQLLRSSSDTAAALVSAASGSGGALQLQPRQQQQQQLQDQLHRLLLGNAAAGPAGPSPSAAQALQLLQAPDSKTSTLALPLERCGSSRASMLATSAALTMEHDAGAAAEDEAADGTAAGSAGGGTAQQRGLAAAAAAAAGAAGLPRAASDVSSAAGSTLARAGSGRHAASPADQVCSHVQIEAVMPALGLDAMAALAGTVCDSRRNVALAAGHHAGLGEHRLCAGHHPGVQDRQRQLWPGEADSE
jgi:hypothetical protein